MRNAILTTKITPPRPPQEIVTRTRLFSTLEECLDTPLTIIVAPAGYGKTSLLTNWIDHTEISTAWLTLNETDNIQKSFLTYFVAAISQIDETIAESRLLPMVSAPVINMELVLITLVSYFSQQSDDICLVLDDYHLIKNEQIHSFLDKLIAQRLPKFHVILSAQSEPPLSIARLRAKRQLHELRIQDLRFSYDETSELIRAFSTTSISSGKVDFLTQRTEGWVAGLQLALLALETGQSALFDRDVASIPDESRFVNDYLSEEVFEQLPQELQDFLLQTCIVSNLTGSLCEALTDDPDSYAHLKEIEKRNLFITRLDDGQNGFRYHQLFSEFLMSRLQQAAHIDETKLYQRAASWFVEQEDAHTAFEFAVKADDFYQAAEIFEQFCITEIGYANVGLVLSWLAVFPEHIFEERPLLASYRAFMMLLTGQMDTCVTQLNNIESGLDESDHRSHGRISAVRAVMACYQHNLTEAGQYAEHARKHLTTEDILFFYGVHIALGDAYRAVGDWQGAIEPYKQAIGINKVTSSVPSFWDVNALSAFADLRMMQGRLRDAADLRQEAIKIIEDHKQQVGYCIPYMGWVYSRWGELMYEWNRLDVVHRLAEEGLELARLGGDHQHMLTAYILLGRVLLVSSDIDGAELQLQAARSLIRSTQIESWQNEIDRFQVEIWLARNDLVSARRWVEETTFAIDADDTYYFESRRLALASILMASANQSDLDRTITLLKRIHTKASQAGRYSTSIEALARLAIAHHKKRDTSQALITLEEAITLAEPEGYIRVFLDLGLPMAQLVAEFVSRPSTSPYTRDLMSAFQSELDIREKQVLIEPLSDRELEILGLVLSGLKNSEIADELILSVGTVKKHLSNIYGKLGVGSRTQAIARARELGLLEE